jgi:hypothetical protein
MLLLVNAMQDTMEHYYVTSWSGLPFLHCSNVDTPVTLVQTQVQAVDVSLSEALARLHYLSGMYMGTFPCPWG